MRKAKTFWGRTMQVIANKKEFALEEGDGSWPTIHFVVANAMLSGATEYDKHRFIDEYARKVSNCLYRVIRELQQSGVPIYWDITPGGGKIKVLSTKPEYKGEDLKRADLKRIERHIRREVKSKLTQIEQKHPTELTGARRKLLEHSASI